MKNEVQLITYIDRLSGGNLRDLQKLLTGPLKGVFGALHLLPFFHTIDGVDAGFDPIDHTQVDARMGDWADIKALSEHLDVMADVIVNHMSSSSPQFLDFSELGAKSDYDGLFLTQDAVFPQGASAADLKAIYRPRPGSPFHAVTLENGEQRVLWSTFTPQQIDIDVGHPQGRAYLDSILQVLAANGVRMVRLDAVGYAIKRAGTSCFMMPETFEFIDSFAARARALGLEVLVEVHAHHRKQIEIAKRVDWVYDFALPPLVLHAFFFKTARYLKDWLALRPSNAVTVLDTHDGIGIIDIGADPADREGAPGLVPPAEVQKLVEMIHANSGGQSLEATGAAASNLDLYQVNCTFFDAMGRDERSYLLARAIQFFMPGVPQVYYVGLLAGCNDMKLLAQSRVGRDINRHRYSRVELDSSLKQAVVQQLIALIRLRNQHPAFNGSFEFGGASERELSMRWTHGAERALLSINFADSSFDLRFDGVQGSQTLHF